MKHLILGSSGQIGGHLVTYLKQNNEEVIEFDIKRSADEDIRYETDTLHKAIQESDFIYFLAYDVGGAKYLEKYQDTFGFIDNNMKIMSNTFKIIDHYKKPFIFASSQMSEFSFSSYGILKALGEKITTDLGGTIVRFWNVYGYEAATLHSHVITDLCSMAKYEGKISTRTNGYEERQMLYGEDAAEVMYLISRGELEGSTIKNRIDITSGQWVSIREIAYMIAHETGIKTLSFSENVDNTQKNAQNEATSLPRYKNYVSRDILNLEWKPKTSLEKGIQNILKAI